MILFPPAKINLGLNVLHKREDGYHEIKSCMAEIPLYDVLELLPSETFEFSQTGLTIDGGSDSNLCVQAYNLMREKYNVPSVYMHLKKQIPMGAGLGGGSADAAYVLLGLNQLFDLGIDLDELERLAAQLGSDCAFFIRGGMQMSEGRGELLTPISADLDGMYLKLIYPNVHISTGGAYANVDFDSDCQGYEEIAQRKFSGLKNSFERHVFETFPELKSIKEELTKEGAIHAAMTGSGSAIFGLFNSKPELGTHENTWVLEFGA